MIQCDYCGKRFKEAYEVRWGKNKMVNTYCEKCFPEVHDNCRKLPWYDGYTKTFIIEEGH